MRHSLAGLKRFRGARAARRSRGITLVELVIAATLVGLVGLSFAFLYFMANEQMVQNINITSSQTEASYAIEHIRRHVVMATDITTPVVGDPDPSTTLIFDFQPAGAAGAQQATYQLNGTDLEFDDDINVNPPAFLAIARHITVLNFNRTDRTAVEVTVTANQGGRPATITATITTRSSF